MIINWVCCSFFLWSTIWQTAMEREYYPLNSIRIHSHWFAPGFSWYRWPRLVVGHLHDRQFDDGQRVCVMYRNEISGAFGVRLTTTRMNERAPGYCIRVRCIEPDRSQLVTNHGSHLPWKTINRVESIYLSHSLIPFQRSLSFDVATTRLATLTSLSLTATNWSGLYSLIFFIYIIAPLLGRGTFFSKFSFVSFSTSH